MLFGVFITLDVVSLFGRQCCQGTMTRLLLYIFLAVDNINAPVITFIHINRILRDINVYHSTLVLHRLWVDIAIRRRSLGRPFYILVGTAPETIVFVGHLRT